MIHLRPGRCNIKTSFTWVDSLISLRYLFQSWKFIFVWFLQEKLLLIIALWCKTLTLLELFFTYRVSQKNTTIICFDIWPFLVFWTKSKVVQKGPKGNKMVKTSVFDHIGPFRVNLDSFGPFQTTRLSYNCAHHRPTKESLTFFLFWHRLVLGGTWSVEDSGGWYMIILGQYEAKLVDTW